MTEYVSHTNSSVKVNIRYPFDSSDQINGLGLHGANGNRDVAFARVMRSCDNVFNFLVKFDCS